MCLAVYVASKCELPIIAWDEVLPAFYVKPLGAHDAAVAQQFRWPNIRYIASCEGCGCGFMLHGADPQQLPLVKEDRQKLVSYIRGALKKDPQLQLFSCWEGDQGLKPTGIVHMSLEELLTNEFEVNERILVDIISESE